MQITTSRCSMKGSKVQMTRKDTEQWCKNNANICNVQDTDTSARDTNQLERTALYVRVGAAGVAERLCPVCSFIIHSSVQPELTHSAALDLLKLSCPWFECKVPSPHFMTIPQLLRTSHSILQMSISEWSWENKSEDHLCNWDESSGKYNSEATWPRRINPLGKIHIYTNDIFHGIIGCTLTFYVFCSLFKDKFSCFSNNMNKEECRRINSLSFFSRAV